MERILVPTDFSKAAQNALDYAVSISLRLKCEIILLNAYSMPHSGSSVMIDVSDVLKNDSIKKLEEEVTRIQLNHPNCRITFKAHNGSPVSSIANITENKNIDLIIMGTTGATGLKETFIGSNTSSLIKGVNTPIIAVPKDYHLKELSNVVVSTDLSHINSNQVFNPLKSILNSEKAHLQIINISENLKSIDPTEFVNEALDMDDMFFGMEHSFKFIESEDVEKGILSHVNDQDADLLVVVSRKRNFFNRLFHKSISKKLTMHSYHGFI